MNTFVNNPIEINQGLSLKRIILSSVLLFLVSVTAINGWLITQLIDSVGAKLGEAAFEVSKSTVESLLPQEFSRSEAIVFQSQTTTEASHDFEIRRLRVPPPHIQLKKEVELQLADSANSRSILLKYGKQQFDIDIPRTQLEKSIVTARNTIIILSAIIIICSLIFFYWFATRISTPIKKISYTSYKIGSGEFGATVDNDTQPIGQELKQLVFSINKMSTHLQQLEKEKQKLQDQQTTSEISEITRGLAHSIRNPLHTILLSLEVLPENLSEQESFKDNIKNQIDRIDRHIKNLMNIATHQSLTSESIVLDDLINRIVKENNHEKLLLNWQNTSSSIIKIQGVESELYSIVQPIIVNAIESYSKDETAYIDITLAKENNQFQLTIADKGSGLTEKIKHNLFKPHVTSKSYGAGMGLYIAQRLVKGRYHGNISAQDNKPKGTVFTVTLKNRED
ncbi:sensor histidine kinase [Pleionea sediminis]|uniref:sensor histidine kinase n=1 Tax=Pleionea sediminis TaxID=2569479 RepID=UPI0013DE24F4|nr:HAMP domain-containing sensor histidine kinase [Pleionea sediminis]